MWAGMWQFPTAETLPAAASAAQLQAWARSDLGLTISAPKRLAAFTHITTHRRIRFVAWRAAARRRPNLGTVFTWRNSEDVDDLPMPNPQRRILKLLSAWVGACPDNLEIPRSVGSRLRRAESI
jgi:adenine-specific DNA glycosylase